VIAGLFADSMLSKSKAAVTTQIYIGGVYIENIFISNHAPHGRRQPHTTCGAGDRDMKRKNPKGTKYKGENPILKNERSDVMHAHVSKIGRAHGDGCGPSASKTTGNVFVRTGCCCCSCFIRQFSGKNFSWQLSKKLALFREELFGISEKKFSITCGQK
jgi:hypothetical protein